MNGLKMVQVALAACADNLSAAASLLDEDRHDEILLLMSQEISRYAEAAGAAQALCHDGQSTADLHMLLQLTDEHVIFSAALIIVKWHLAPAGELKDRLWDCHEWLEGTSDLIEAVKADLPDVPPAARNLN